MTTSLTGGAKGHPRALRWNQFSGAIHAPGLPWDQATDGLLLRPHSCQGFPAGYLALLSPILKVFLQSITCTRFPVSASASWELCLSLLLHPSHLPFKSSPEEEPYPKDKIWVLIKIVLSLGFFWLSKLLNYLFSLNHFGLGSELLILKSTNILEDRTISWFIYSSFYKYLLSTCCIPANLLGSVDIIQKIEFLPSNNSQFPATLMAM